MIASDRCPLHCSSLICSHRLSYDDTSPECTVREMPRRMRRAATAAAAGGILARVSLVLREEKCPANGINRY
jgi:hypothetical protein